MKEVLMKESIVDHVPDTDSTGRSPMEESSSVESSAPSIYGDSLDGTDNSASKPKQQSPSPIFASNENSALRKFKIMLYGVMLVCALGISAAVYTYLRRSEKTDFEQTFELYSSQVMSSVGTQLEQNMATLDSFALGLISYASVSASIWPFVTLPNSSPRMAKIRAQTKSAMIVVLNGVSNNQREEYEAYTMQDSGWVNETIAYQLKDGSLQQLGLDLANQSNISSKITYFGQTVPPKSGPYAPSWQSYPLLDDAPSFNVDAMQNPAYGQAIRTLFTNNMVILVSNNSTGEKEPFTSLLYPIIEGKKPKAVINLVFQWSMLFQDILGEEENGVVVVVENPCSSAFSYVINGPNVTFLGVGDLHDTKFNDLVIEVEVISLIEGSYMGVPLDPVYCPTTISCYPSETLQKDNKSIVPLMFTFGTICIFLFTWILFYIYDMLVAYRQQKVLKAAQKSEAIVSALFPDNVRDRLFNKSGKGKKKSKDKKSFEPPKARMRNFLSSESEADVEMDMMGESDEDRPIADLFPETTIMFADIAGFTAWSSVREPSQVFTLLEKIYGAFDHIAVRRGVFKVETIGDSYVAVCGLPEPRADHAVVMVRFADHCRASFAEITRELEFSLGPETGDLRMRFGLNSGPTTAGVLRGQKSRFQLFGDTVNTAARMESTGLPNCIHISQATADYLLNARKQHWLEARAEKIDVKGKGMMQTYFADPRSGNSLSQSTHSGSAESFMAEMAHRNERMVYWCTDIMGKLLRQIIARREAAARANRPNTFSGSSTIASADAMSLDSSGHGIEKLFKKGGQVIEEVVEVIRLPEFDGAIEGIKGSEVSLDNEILKQLREYVTEISGTYRENPFHNFEHASHVVMSVAKLLSRIVAPDLDIKDGQNVAANLHDHTYGITSDPLTQFACVFAALIHDVDHYGIPNAQLVKERAPLAYKYKNRSPAEQNSVNIAWKILMKPQFNRLRMTICPTEEEMRRFRQLVVNSVMATDIADKEMKELRNARWAKAFSQQAASEESERTNINRKATIVIEHLIQASDVAHTMQHWHVYTKWNERLFQEMSLAYLVGRSDNDPVQFWYKGELGFFDFYIIPLAKKLSECGVFGVSSDEYLNYAMRNREEWERRGNDMLQGMIERFQVKLQQEYGDLAALESSNRSATSAIESSGNETE